MSYLSCVLLGALILVIVLIVGFFISWLIDDAPDWFLAVGLFVAGAMFLGLMLYLLSNFG